MCQNGARIFTEVGHKIGNLTQEKLVSDDSEAFLRLTDLLLTVSHKLDCGCILGIGPCRH